MLYIKFLSILESKQKFFLSLLIVFSLIAMILETLSIGLILPLLDNIINEQTYDNSFLSNIISRINKNLDFDYLTSFSFIILIFFLMKSIFLVVFYFLQSKFASSILITQSDKFFNLYLNQKWTFYTANNSSVFIRNIMNEIGSLMVFSESIIIFISEILILIGLLSLLFIVNFETSLIAFSVLFFISLLYFFSTKNFLYSMGNKRVNNDYYRLKYLNEAFKSIKEIKIFSKEYYFLQNYSKHNFVVANVRQFTKIFSYIPRILIELVIVLLVVISIIYFNNSKMNIKEVIPMAGIYFAALIRIYPSIVKILNTLQTFKYNHKSVNNLFNDFNNLEKVYSEREEDKIKFNNLIEFKNVDFRHNSRSKHIFSNLNIIIKKNTSFGLVGKSGVGKTTFVDLLMGLLDPTNGKIMVDNNDIKETKSNWRSFFGYVPQQVVLFDSDIKSNIAFGLEEKQINFEKLNTAIKLAELDEFINNLDEGINTKVGENASQLSGGQKQRIGIARALYNDPEILVFDESTSSLDTTTEKSIIETINRIKLKKTIFIISHNQEVVKICDEVYKIENCILNKT